MTSPLNWWRKLPIGWRKEITSVGLTFVSTFVGAVILQEQVLVDGDWPLISAVAVSAARAALKAAWLAFITRYDDSPRP
jgi:hypothetical protein